MEIIESGKLPSDVLIASAISGYPKSDKGLHFHQGIQEDFKNLIEILEKKQ